MSIFRCSSCGCIENTACSNYWEQRHPFGGGEPKPALCSECDPETGKWHGRFERTSAKGFVLADDGFLYSKEDVATESFKWRMKNQGLKVVREIAED